MVVATHADEALRLLGEPSDEERRVLGAFGYTTNDTVLHTDPSLLPRRRAARASWNYRARLRVSEGRPTMTYYLNRLQQLEADRDYCVTLNRSRRDRRRIRDRALRLHASASTRSRAWPRSVSCSELSGPRHTASTRARYHGNGFHEDGLASGVRAAALLGVDVVSSALYDGTLVHARRTPAENVFRYRVAYYVLDLDDLDELERRLHLFSVNRRTWSRSVRRDHFDDDGRSLKEAAVAFCAERGVEGVERVVMLAQLRFLGYVFNPVSFYWCYRADGELACMIAELNNTFGERLPELLRGGSLRYEHDKRLHVSPFFGLDQQLPLRLLGAGRLPVRAHRGARGPAGRCRRCLRAGGRS